MSIYRISHADQNCLLAVICLIIKNDKAVMVTHWTLNGHLSFWFLDLCLFLQDMARSPRLG